MKKYAAVAIVAAFTAGSVEAAGFQPWAGVAVQSQQDAVQSEVTAKPFYQNGIPQIEDTAATRRADVIIKPWYAADRV